MAAPLDTSAEPTQPHPTTLYILIPPSPLFAAHWSLYLPTYSPHQNPHSKRHEELPLGRRIHVSGDRLHGFTLEIVRDYDIRAHRAVGSRRFPIGRVPNPFLLPKTTAREEESGRKDSDEGGGYISTTPIDAFEEVCTSVPAPGPSLNRVGGGGGGGSSGEGKAGRKPAKAEVRDCQWWVREVVAGLVEKGMLEPLLPARSGEEMKGPEEIVEGLPVH